MQSTARVVVMTATVERNRRGSARSRKRPGLLGASRARERDRGSGVVLGLHDLAAAVETGGADVVTQVRFAGGRLHCDTRHRQRVVRTVHAALRRRLLVLLDGHGGLLESV